MAALPNKHQSSLLAQYQSGLNCRELKFEHRTLPSVIQIQARLGDKVMIRTTDSVITYGEAPDIAAHYGGKLIACGIEPGDRVVTFMSSRMDVFKLWLGLTWVGAVMVPINTDFRGEQLRHAISLAKPKLIVFEASLQKHLAAVADAVETAKSLLCVDYDANVDAKSGLHTPIKPFVTDALPAPMHDVHPADTAAILYTSGTTGPSKGVLCPHAQFFWWGVLTSESLDIGQDDVLFTVLPLFHTNALNALWQAILCGATYSFSPRFSASRFWQEARENNATITYLLGAMAQILLKQTPAEIDSSHGIRSALCPAMSPEMVQEFDKRFSVHLLEGYGSTETNLVFSNVIGGYAPASMGRVVDGFDVRIVDENDCDVENGKPGELIIRHTEPFSVASGYFENPEATVKAWRNLWFHTGDRVYRDGDGIYYFLDRLVDAIRRRGENISSWEVENALMAHPDIEEAAVFGVPSDLGSEEDVMTHVVMRGAHTPDPVAIVRFLEGRVAYFAIPRYWDFVDDLPKTQNGKVKKHLLRSVGVRPETFDVDAASIKINRS